MDSKEYLAFRSNIAQPQVYYNILPRSRIIQLMDNVPPDRAICMVAPYGYGKTLAVVSWLRDRQRKAAWVTLDGADYSKSMFINRLTAAVLSFIGGQTAVTELLSENGNRESSESFLWEIVSQDARDNREKILVIDNFHFVRDPELLTYIMELIYMLLEHWRVIMISRTEMPHAFNDLMLKGHSYFITSKDLSFSSEETAAYFKLNGCYVSRQDIIQIRNETDGWSAALNVILALSRSGPIGYNEAVRSYMMLFFESEVWAGLDEKTKDFLLKTSILDKLTPASCHAVTDMGATHPILKQLFQNGFFISKPDERDAFYYHRVFREFLLEKLHSSGIDERELHMKVAWWLFERNEIVKSFPYFFKAGDLYGIGQALKILAPTEMGMERFLELTSCITTLDIVDLKPYPAILAVMALIQYVKGNLTEMQALCCVFTEWIKPGVLPISPEDYAEYVWEAGWLSYLNPDEKVGFSKSRTAWCNYKEFAPQLEKLYASRCATLAFPSMMRGIRDFALVATEVERLQEQAKKTGQNPYHDEYILLSMDLLVAEYAYETEDFEKAEEITRRLMPKAKEMPYADFYFMCVALLVKLQRAARKSNGIELLTTRLRTVITEKKNDFLLPNFHAFELRNNLANGHTGFTQVFEEENREYRDKPFFYLLYRHFTYVRGLLSSGDYIEATLILDNIDQLCLKYKRSIGLIEAKVLRSIALYGLEDKEGACRFLTEALEGAKSHGFIRIISDDAKEIWPILSLLGKQTTDIYINKVIISCKKVLDYTGRKATLKEYAHLRLTKTELRILKSLKIGMSYKEIALDHNIRLSTVKTHVHSIYSKLEASNKTTAIMTAQKKGILE